MSTLTETDRMAAQPSTDTSPAERVLIVEDDPSTRVGLTELVTAWGFQTEEAANGEEALQKVTTFRPAIIVSDLVMPRMGGLDLLRSLKDQLSDLTLILLTAQGTVESAVEAIKEGAYDYLSKPVDPQRLRILLQKAVERQETLREVRLLRRQLREQGSFGRIIGNSPGIRGVYRVIEQSAPTQASVLISGESGTGKELVAQTIHELSPRATFPSSRSTARRFPRRCSRASSSAMRRAPSPARTTRGSASSSSRIAARSFSTRSPRCGRRRRSSSCACCRSGVRRLGGRQEQTVDVRVIAATNQIRRGGSPGKLREDLFYRLNVFAIELPPLRERREDVPLLIQTFLTEFNSRNGKSVRAIDQENDPDSRAVSLAGQHP